MPASGWLHIWPIHFETFETGWQQDAALLDGYERARAGRFKFQHHSHNYINRWIAYRKILAHYTREAPGNVHIARTRHGKPFLPENTVQFSTSSSARLAILAVSNSPVGIDIEHRSRLLVENPGIELSFLSPVELRYLSQVPSSERARLLMEIWTVKEAYLKALGSGLLTDPRSIAFDLETRALLELGDSWTTTGWELYQPELCDGYSLAVSTQNSVQCQIIQSNTVVDMVS